MKRIMMGMLLLGCLMGCASSQAVDDQADEALGISQAAENENAAETLQDAKEDRIQEAQRNLQRQITEPIQAVPA